MIPHVHSAKDKEEDATHLFFSCNKNYATLVGTNIVDKHFRSISAKSETALPPAFAWEGNWHQISEIAVLVDLPDMEYLAASK